MLVLSPFFYDAAYRAIKRDSIIPITKRGVFFVAEQAECRKDKKKDADKPPKSSNWKCTDECKMLSD